MMSRNGRLSGSELVDIDNGQRLAPTAASRWLALIAAAAAGGVHIVTTEGYRDYDTQVRLWNLYGHPRASRPGLSPHGWGLAVDINTTGFSGAVFNWMTANAGRFGFNNIIGRSINEHWHWVYDGTGTAGFSSTPLPTHKEIPMRTVQYFQMIDDKGNDLNDWSRIGADVLPIGDFPGGYEATSDINVARLWGRQIAGAGTAPVKLKRADYVKQQQLGAREYQLHRADDIARIGEAIGENTTPLTDKQLVQLGRQIAASFPELIIAGTARPSQL